MNSSNLLNFEFYLLFSLELLTFCQKGTQQFICFLALLILCDNVRLVNRQCTLELIDVFHTDRLLIFTSFSHSKRLIVFIENPMNKIDNFHFFLYVDNPSFSVINSCKYDVFTLLLYWKKPKILKKEFIFHFSFLLFLLRYFNFEQSFKLRWSCLRFIWITNSNDQEGLNCESLAYEVVT